MQPQSDPRDLLAAHKQTHHTLVKLFLEHLRPIPSDPATLSIITGQVVKLLPQPISNEKQNLRLALCQTLVEVLRSGAGNPAKNDSPFAAALRVIDCSISLFQEGLIDEESPFRLLLFFTSMCTLSQLEAGVNEVQQRFAKYAVVNRRKIVGLRLLQLAMSWTDRDKAGWKPAFIGKLRLMTAAALPAWHLSGMNKTGKYNADVEVDYEAPIKDNAAGGVDLALYKHFWSVLKAIRNFKGADMPSQWEVIQVGIEKVLEAFETLPLSGEGEDAAMEDLDEPGYMISPSILRLQIADLRFRRRVLLQYTIFLAHLELIGERIPAEKEGAEALKKMEFYKALFAHGGHGEKVKIRVVKQLERDTNGKFKRFVIPQLQRDRKWVHWKKIGYKHLNDTKEEAPKKFKRRAVLSPVPPKEAEGPMEKKRRVEDESKQEWQVMQETWSVLPSGDLLLPLIAPGRQKLPSVEAMKSELREDMNDSDLAEEDKRKNNKKYVWRSLRMLTERSIDTCLEVIDMKGTDGVDLERCVRSVDAKASSGNTVAEGEGATTNP